MYRPPPHSAALEPRGQIRTSLPANAPFPSNSVGTVTASGGPSGLSLPNTCIVTASAPPSSQPQSPLRRSGKDLAAICLRSLKKTPMPEPYRTSVHDLTSTLHTAPKVMYSALPCRPFNLKPWRWGHCVGFNVDPRKFP